MAVPLARFLLHHDPDAALGAKGLDAFLAQPLTHQFAVIFHTTGALLVAGALAAVLLLKSVRDPATGTAWTEGSRMRTRIVLFAGWGINFLGGTMRLYEPDHPGLGAIGTEAWVQLLVLKHLALLAAIVFSVFAVEIGPRRMLENIRAHAGVALILVVASSVIGGVASGVPLPDLGTDVVGATDTDGHEGHLNTTFLWQNHTVQVSGTPLGMLPGGAPAGPGPTDVSLSVPQNATEIVATLQWATPGVEITAILLYPNGTVAGESGSVDGGTAEVSAGGDLVSGSWTLRIRSTAAAAEPVSVVSRITQGPPPIRVLEETVTIRAPGFEINLYMAEGAWFNYTWSVAEGEPAVAWDIHSHPGGQVVTHVSGTDTGAEGNFTAGPDEIYSLFWQPTANQVLTLTYRVEGPFRVHSIFRGA